MLNFEYEVLPLVGRKSLSKILDRMLQKIIATSRTDWAMLLAILFLIIRVGGKWSMDSYSWKQ